MTATRPIGGDEPAAHSAEIANPSDIERVLAGQSYLSDRGLATAIFLSLTLGQPLLLEGEAGVGKTEVAKALAAGLGRRLVRLQCYEGIDAGQALYEWDYSRQLLYLRALTERGSTEDESLDDLFGDRFLLERPLLTAIRVGGAAVLLIDEIDRADDEFEAFLLEVLSDFQITIPEIGTITAPDPPFVVLTSNRTRELHDALKRRCLYHWIGYPTVEREVAIVRERAPEIPIEITHQVAEVVGRLRGLDLIKHPGVAETISWARALAYLGLTHLDPKQVGETLGAVLKERDDIERVAANLTEVLSGAARGT
jgi:MoxR-like ATPase